MNMKAIRSLIGALVVGLLISAGAIGCNTFKGAGKDIQKGGEKVENAAEAAQNK